MNFYNNTFGKLMILGSSAVIVLCSIFLFYYIDDYDILFHKWPIKVHDDRNEPGNSEIKFFRNDSTGIEFSYLLHKGFAYPFAGFTILLQDRNGNLFDCRHYDALRLRVASSRQSDCKLYLNLFDEKISVKGEPLKDRHLFKNLEINSTPTVYRIPLKQFNTPEWWFQKNNITMKDVAQLDFSKVTSLIIESGLTATIGTIDTLTITEISFERNWHTPLLLSLFLALLLIIVFSVKQLYSRFNDVKKKQSIVITYDKKEVQSYQNIDTQRLSDYLSKKFSDPELSILTTGASLGLSQKKIAKIMNTIYKMSFKQYLLSIRLHEAKRLLKETDRLVSNIASEVGFNSISNFNRVFKTAELMSPLEFRNKKTD